ncbi:hypothetical protein B566_EDAN009246 [Ephemera danica]|nr:hypothetical protein B566_EDAN009246 [Ephemera danica]
MQQRPRVLATTVLRREAGDDDQELEEDQLETNDATPPHFGDLELVATALTYWQEPSSEYWGQGRGMLRGLNTAIHIKSESIPRIIEWGVNSTHPGSEQAITVQAKLPLGTGQNVSVTGNHTTSETPYTARLIAHYKDGVTRSRTINGTVNQVSLQGVKVIYGAHYFLHDGSLVPTTTTTTTTPSSTTSSTTPSTTTTATAKVPVASQVLNDTKDEAPVAMSTDKNVAESLNDQPSAAPVSCRQSFMIVIACLLVIGFRSGT